MSTTYERVAAGAAFLDEREPGWDQRIDVRRLFMLSDCSCVIGQLKGGFFPGALELGLTDRGATDSLGFSTDPLSGDEYSLLSLEWRRLIRERQAAVPA